MNFTERVHQVVKTIPAGQTLTYKEVAEKAGRPLAYRSVGNILNKNFDHTIPCHRVMGAKGLTGFSGAGGVETKVWLLKHEGAAGLLI